MYNKYKKHIYAVSVAEGVVAPNAQLYTIEQIKSERVKGNEVLIRLRPGVNIREVIASLNTNYELRGFQEVLPTMNEIFIETVTGKTTNQGGVQQ